MKRWEKRNLSDAEHTMCSCKERWYVWCQLTEELLGRWRWNNKTELKLWRVSWLIALQLSSSSPRNRPSPFFTPPGIFNILFIPKCCRLFTVEYLQQLLFCHQENSMLRIPPIISHFFTIPLITRQYGAAGQNFKYAFLLPSACFPSQPAIPHHTSQKAAHRTEKIFPFLTKFFVFSHEWRSKKIKSFFCTVCH